MAGHLNFIQIYFLKVIKQSFLTSFNREIFLYWEKHLAMMTEISVVQCEDPGR